MQICFNFKWGKQCIANSTRKASKWASFIYFSIAYREKNEFNLFNLVTENLSQAEA